MKKVTARLSEKNVTDTPALISATIVSPLDSEILRINIRNSNFFLSIARKIFLFLFFTATVTAQEYIIGQADELSISFWQQPDLNIVVRVEQDGKIDLPVIGKIVASGLTTSELSNSIVEKISNYNKDISQASVAVLSYGSNKIYVTGHVLSPGKYTFEVIPNLWEAILEAGGAGESALLSQINIIRGEFGRAENAENVVVNLANEIKSGDLTLLLKLYPGDTIYVPGLSAEVGGINSDGPQLSNNYVFIYGQVKKAGVYTLGGPTDILRTLVMAGGMTPLADLEEIRIISQLGRFPTVVTLDLEKYSTEGEPGMFLLNPGDTIFVPRKNDSIFSGARGKIVGELLRVLLATGTSVLLYSAVRR